MECAETAKFTKQTQFGAGEVRGRFEKTNPIWCGVMLRFSHSMAGEAQVGEGEAKMGVIRFGIKPEVF